ncbi:uncharacterized protein LOC119461176 [Dermacentor silvarum]|uniref:uncharacterized protein LOC119461176 n=1 Tax=Dermacentor silvarum TaxID=543639 RepID=UPI002100F2FA|nr:uncharacterized protein LOC119461176 [Dermacentor silvarum]
MTLALICNLCLGPWHPVPAPGRVSYRCRSAPVCRPAADRVFTSVPAHCYCVLLNEDAPAIPALQNVHCTLQPIKVCPTSVVGNDTKCRPQGVRCSRHSSHSCSRRRRVQEKFAASTRPHNYEVPRNGTTSRGMKLFVLPYSSATATRSRTLFNGCDRMMWVQKNAR